MPSNDISRACSFLNTFTSGQMSLSVSQPTITAGNSFPVNWNGSVPGSISDNGGFKFTLGLFPASNGDTTDPLTTTAVTVPADGADSGVANLKSSPNVTGCVPFAVWHSSGTDARPLTCLFYLQADGRPSSGV
jgi:hypothetical protein